MGAARLAVRIVGSIGRIDHSHLRTGKLGLIVVDYVQLMSGSDGPRLQVDPSSYASISIRSRRNPVSRWSATEKL